MVEEEIRSAVDAVLSVACGADTAGLRVLALDADRAHRHVAVGTHINAVQFVEEKFGLDAVEALVRVVAGVAVGRAG